jgi:hypothetical protein
VEGGGAGGRGSQQVGCFEGIDGGELDFLEAEVEGVF